MIAQQDSIRTYSSFGIFDKVMDRFGRDHSWTDLRLDSVTTSNVFIESIGMFDLYFFNGCGLEDSSNTTHNQRRAVLKELFSFANDVWNSSTITGRIPVRFLPQTMGDSLPSGFPVLASSFYFTPAFSAQFSEVSDCAISQMINAGNNPYYALANYSTQRSMSGGLMSFSMLDFYTDFDSYQLNTDLHLSVVNATTYDLYSVALRELLLGLGLNSLMRINTESLSVNTFQYSRFDQQIHWQNQPALIYQPSLKKYIPNPLVDFSSFLISGTSNCDSIVSCSASPYVADSTIRLHSSHCFQPGIDLSYIQSDCSNLPSVLSNDWGVGTVRRRMTADDMKLLCAIGYTINGCFGDSTISNNFCGTGLSSFNVHSVNFSGLTSNGSYKHVVTDSLEVFALSELIDQYNLVTEIAFVDYLGVANGPQLIGDSLYLTSIHLGQQIIRLQLGYDNAFNSTHYLLIRYRGGQVCNYNNCNLVGNDSFEETFQDVECGAMENEPTNNVNLFCWTPFGTNNTPDLYSENCQQSLWDFSDDGTLWDSGDIPFNPDPLNNRIVHLVSALVPVNDPFGPPSMAYAEESIQGQLLQPLEEGNTYEISLRVFRKLPGGIPRLRIFLRSGEYGGDGLVINNPSTLGLTSVGATYEITENEWVTISFQFTCPASDMPLDYIVIHNQASGPPPTSWALDFRWLYIDDVRLSLQQDVTFNIPQDFVCNNVPLNSLQNFGSPLGGEVFGPGVIGNTSFTFVPGLAGPGTHEITYAVTTSDDCQLTASDFITVHPTVTFGTPLSMPTCGQSCSGSLSVNPTLNAPGSVTYTWTGPSINAANQNLLSLTNLCAGTYTLTAVVNGVCISQQNYFVPSAAPPTASASVSFDICNVSCNSTIQVTTNNTSNTISWTGGLNGFNPTGVCPGIYTATVTNPQGCSTSIQVNVTPSAGPDLTISGTQTLNGSNLGYNTIIVESGAYLTIVTPSGPLTIGNRIEVQSGGRLKITSANIRFLPQAMVRVRRGGRAYIQGGVLTAHCPGTFWHGIEVLGNSANDHVAVLTSMQNFESADTDGNNDQGGLLIDKLALIERAQIGVRLFTGNMPNPGSSATNSGGYIRAHEVTFRNNTRDLASSTMTHDNKSRLSRVSFELNQNSLNTSWNIRPRVELHNTRGVSFEGCTWSNTNTNLLNGNGSNVFQMTGLSLIQSSCIVKEFIVGTSVEKSKLNGFVYGIRGSGNALDEILVQSTDFRCYRGIYGLSWPDNSAVLYCTFNNLNTATGISIQIPPAFINANNGTIWTNFTSSNGTSANTGPAYGLYLDACSKVVAQFNTFELNSTTEANQRIGCYVNNCGAALVQIKDNKFRGNTYGIRFFNVNRNSGSPTTDGTTFSCNEFVNNRRHVEINSVSSNLNAGINVNIYFNGQTSYSNLFFNNTNTIFPSGRYIQRINTGTHNFRSFGQELNGITDQIVIGTNPNILAFFPNPNCGDSIPLNDRSQLLQNLMFHQQEYLNYRDDGQPSYYEQQIQGININNLLSRYNELMEISPALSSDNILELLNKEMEIPRSMLLSILLNNASSLKNGDIWNRLDELDEPLSIWDRDSLLSALNLTDEKELIQISLNTSLYNYQTRLFSDYLTIRLDSTLSNKDYLLQVLREENDALFPLRSALFQALNEFNWIEIEEIILQWQSNIKENTHEHKDLQMLSLLVSEAQLNGLKIDSLPDDYNGFASNFVTPEFPLTYRTAALIASIFEASPFHGDLEYGDVEIEPRSRWEIQKLTSSQMQLQLYPNPSADLTRILSLNDDLLDCSIRCLDILGKEHSIEVISKSPMECVLNVQSLVNGNYILEITSENGLSSLPLIIAK